MDEHEKETRKLNNAKDYEVWIMGVQHTAGGDISTVHYDHEATVRNFMRLVAEKLDIK